jgi:hypothetical protein
MDQYRRRPPLGEGFLRDKLGGELVDDDTVEGHTMTIGKRFDDEDKDVEGHGFGGKKATPDEDKDVEGHGWGGKKATPDEDDDTEGHGGVLKK